MNALLRVSDEVARVLAARGPVVALETTVVTHGLPHPDGLRVAAELEGEVRAAGATPATIGVLDGHVRVGLSAGELARLAEAPQVPKLNLSNLALHVAAGGARLDHGRGHAARRATRAGIAVMATGGIGGVHREAERTGDVSADLAALARYRGGGRVRGRQGGARHPAHARDAGDAGRPGHRLRDRSLPRLLPARQRAARSTGAATTWTRWRPRCARTSRWAWARGW